MAINKNSKKARIARDRHTITQCKTRTIPVGPSIIWRSIKKSHFSIPEDSDGSYLEGPEETSHHQSCLTTHERKAPNPVVPNIETLHTTRDGLQGQATLAMRQGEKLAEVW